MSPARTRYPDIERWSPPLIRGAVISALLMAIALGGLLLDSRIITDAPAWLKPAKFGASGVIYMLSLAWMIRDLPRTRALRIASNLIAWILVVEIALINLQAARGTTSHFNIDTPLDTVIFSSMGIGIATVWLMSMLLLYQHLRSKASDRTMAIALRLGLALNIVGAGVGWTMTQPRPAQLAALKRGEHPMIAGSHTVGGKDGGPGLPVTRWSQEHGDLRVPHFLGMHALQLLPLIVLGLRRVRQRQGDTPERAAVMIAGAACAAIFLAALAQALSGHPLLPLTTG
jgi:hypothetical protein